MAVEITFILLHKLYHIVLNSLYMYIMYILFTCINLFKLIFLQKMQITLKQKNNYNITVLFYFSVVHFNYNNNIIVDM
jgi:hypothetical protein